VTEVLPLSGCQSFSEREGISKVYAQKNLRTILAVDFRRFIWFFGNIEIFLIIFYESTLN
jgi:hypothetical protein